MLWDFLSPVWDFLSPVWDFLSSVWEYGTLAAPGLVSLPA